MKQLLNNTNQNPPANPLSLFSSCFLTSSLSSPCIWCSRGVELLATLPGHLEGLQMCSSGAADRSISGDFPCLQLRFASFTISPHFKLNLKISFSSIIPPPLSLWVMALIENANCNQISWIKMSGLKMGDIRDNSHGSAWGMKRLAEIMGTWVWSVYEFLMVCFGRCFGGAPMPSYWWRKLSFSEMRLQKKL